MLICCNRTRRNPPTCVVVKTLVASENHRILLRACVTIVSRISLYAAVLFWRAFIIAKDNRNDFSTLFLFIVQHIINCWSNILPVHTYTSLRFIRNTKCLKKVSASYGSSYNNIRNWFNPAPNI